MASRITFNPRTASAILKSGPVQAELSRRAARIAAAAGDGFVVQTGIGPSRAYARVYTGTFRAMAAETYHRDLTRAIDAGR